MSMHLRVAAGVCAVSTGLLIVGPATAIAAADTGADGSSSMGGGSVRNPIGGLADSLGKAFHDTAQNALQGVTGTLNALAKSGSQPSSVIKPPKMNFGGTPTVHGSTGVDPTGPEDGALDEAGEAPTAPGESAPAIKTNDAAPGTVQTNVFAPPVPTFPAASVPIIPIIPPVPPVVDVVAPVSNVFTAVVGSVASTPALLAALPTSATPVSDVIGSLQALLTSVVDASAPLAQLPADLTDLLTVATTTPGAATGVRADGIGSSVGVAAIKPMPIPTSTTLLPALSGFGQAPTPDVLGGPTLLDVKTTGAATGVTGTVAAVATPAAGASVLSTVERVIGVVVATVSITALLAVALPGILGLLGTCAAGIRIGYRQAKAGAELPDTAIARFVGSGPVGVVRSGSQIALRPRVARQALGRARSSGGERPAQASLQLLDRAV